MDNKADSSHPFRDGTAGAEARRLKLLRDRRDELATMSHEIRQIYVRRFSRILAATALALGGAVVVAASLDQSLANAIAGLLPGKTPAALSTTLLTAWVVAGFALFSGRAWAERRFGVAMSKAVLPTEELHTDVSRLACEDPAQVGRAITRRLVPISRMVSILASGLIFPVSALALYLVVKANGYPLVDDVELLFEEQATNLLLIGGMTVVVALRLGLSANWRPSFMTALGAALFFPAVFVFAPSLLLAVLGASALLALTAYLHFRRRSREDARIEQDGVPVPPVILFRKRIKQLWAMVWSVTHIFRWSSWKSGALKLKGGAKHCLAFRPSTAQWLSGVVLVGAGVGMAVVYAGQKAEAAEARTQDAFSINDWYNNVDQGDTQTSFSTLNLGDMDVKYGASVDFTFYNGQAVDATEHLSDARIPSGWRATVTVTMVNGEGRLHVEALDAVDEGSNTRQLSDSTPDVTFERTNCTGMDIPLLFNVTPYGAWEAGETSASLRYEVNLELVTGC